MIHDILSDNINIVALPITVLVDATTDLIARIGAIGAHLHPTMKEVTVPVAVGMTARVHDLILLVSSGCILLRLSARCLFKVNEDYFSLR